MTHPPITPPPELVQQWWTEFERTEPDTDSLVFIATQAARWGADQELEACDKAVRKIWQMDCVFSIDDVLRELRAARRPKPPSLKEQALEALDRMDQLPTAEDHAIIRRALESLPE